MHFELIKLRPEDKEQYKKDMKEAFQIGAE